MVSRDQKYFVIKRLIEGGDIVTFPQIFDHIAKTKVAQDLGLHYNRLRMLLTADEKWVLADLYKLAQMIGISDDVILRLILRQREERKTKGSKRKN